MAGLQITITDAGRAALPNGPNTGTSAVTISHVGVSPVHTAGSLKALTSLPGEVKRVTTFGGDIVADDVMHVTINDETTAVYSVRAFGLYLSTGVLFAVFSSPDVVVEKSAGAMVLLSADITFKTLDTAVIQFGGTGFINPPATTERLGVVELATWDEAAAGNRADVAVTPYGLLRALQSWATNFAAAIHRHAMSSIDGLPEALAAKQNRLNYTPVQQGTGIGQNQNFVKIGWGESRLRVTVDETDLGNVVFDTNLQFALASKAEAAHDHDASAVRTGVFDVGRIPALAIEKVTGLAATLAGKQNALNYTPVQQGTGFGQGSNFVKIGWSGARLRATVDDLDLGEMVFEEQLAPALATKSDLGHHHDAADVKTGTFDVGRIPALAIEKVTGLAAILAGKQSVLNYTPVQQGTGFGQGSNFVKIGWGGSRLRATVDDLDLGEIVFEAQLAPGLATKSDLGHQHDAADVKTGIFDVGRIPALAIEKVTGLAAILAGKQNALNYTPVQQGTGVGQSAGNQVKLGWDGDGLRCTVDADDQGSFVFEAQLADALSGKSNLGHQHDAADVKSGTFDVGRIPALAMEKITGLAAVLAGKQPVLGYIPVQQGTGVGQSAGNQVKLGWDGDGLRCTVDADDQGSFVFEAQLAEALAAKSGLGHQHDAADVKSGTFDVGRIPALAMEKITGLAAVLAGKQPVLGYIPVQQGTGVGQSPGNQVKLGWDGSRLRLTIDDSDLGPVVTEANLFGFARSLGSPGYAVIPGTELMLQWGVMAGNISEGETHAVLPVAFGGGCLIALANPHNPGRNINSDYYMQVVGHFVDRIAFFANRANGSAGNVDGYEWLALGRVTGTPDPAYSSGGSGGGGEGGGGGGGEVIQA